MKNAIMTATFLACLIPLYAVRKDSEQMIFSSNGHSYQRFDTEIKTWRDARDFCVEQGGYLATIASAEENRLYY